MKRRAALMLAIAGGALMLFGHGDGAAQAAARVASGAPGQWRAAALPAGYLAADELPIGSYATPLRL